MNLWLLLGGLLLIGAAGFHSLMGEKVVLARLYRRAQERPEGGRRAYDDPAVRNSIRLAWHSLSVALVGFAALLFNAGLHQDAFGAAWNGVATILVATFAALALLTLATARGRHVGWMWYIATAATAWLSRS